jgi:hypothetical protein
MIVEFKVGLIVGLLVISSKDFYSECAIKHQAAKLLRDASACTFLSHSHIAIPRNLK